MPDQKDFWKDGIRFECQDTGKCCTSRGSYGYVYLTLNDRRRMAEHLGMSTWAFTRSHCERQGDYYHLKNPDKDCQFLDQKRCTVYEGRPAQCRTWPFWPENMNPKTWSKEVASFCPGVGKGKLYTESEIKALMRQDPVG